jgi:hypothetical protein
MGRTFALYAFPGSLEKRSVHFPLFFPFVTRQRSSPARNVSHLRKRVEYTRLYVLK